MKAYLLVFAGAGLGGMLRHAANLAAARWMVGSVPLGTACVNVAGCFAVGLLVGYFALRADPGQHWRLFLATGVLGGFTTFSAFSLDATLIYERGQLGAAATYVAATVAACILAVFAGLAVMRQLLAP